MKKTKCYKFKEVDLVSLRELALKVKSQTGFRLRYGGLLTLLRTDVDEKLVHTLVQFYDPSFRCFTFPDFQLVPTLEAYSNLVGLPIAEKTPFTGPGTSLTPLVIAKDLYLKTSDVFNHLITKSHIRGFTSKYLLDQANLGTTRQDTLEAILALLIYGLILFPNLDNFVDINAIEIFHSKNPVPTLLADTYHAIHDRTLKGRGYILCCTSLLYRWFISHLPSSFHDNSENWSYSQRIMALTPNEVVWLTPAAQVKEIIMGCGDFLNVPLLGTRGGINYNPELAMRQFGFPMKSKPINLATSPEFFFYMNAPTGQRKAFIDAWSKVRRKSVKHLGVRSGVAHEAYTQWVIDRAEEIGMPYPAMRYVSSSTPSMPLPLLPATQDMYQEHLAMESREKQVWKARYNQAENLIMTLDGRDEQKTHENLMLKKELAKVRKELEEKDELLMRDSKRARGRRDFFDRYCDSDSESDDLPTTSYA
ncbi:hypothetical protein MtrunA17_Chr5g0406451 [Medicago truncatula]|uniref:DUF7745 domain-containing protein n=1 Tax=Medicago truncatula TaxID=3880 RepID=A0A396HPB1_MEDTR|nr:hypothetical protein MtrunA17_Chr5g0406451 [Medicago truncatula]